MPLPDPDMYDNWKLWAKASNLQINRTARVENNWISDFEPITSFSGLWTSDAEHPLCYSIFKNGTVYLSGMAECSGAHSLFDPIFTLPHAARPLQGHDYGAGEMFILEAYGWGAGSYKVFPLFFNVSGVVSGAFTIVSGTSQAFFDSIHFRGAVSR